GTRPDHVATSGGGSVPAPATDTTTTASHAGRRRVRRALRKAWPAARIIFGFGLVGVAVWVLSSRTSELEGFSTASRKFICCWVPPAVAVEIGSYYCFAAMQFELLRAGHLRPPWNPF